MRFVSGSHPWASLCLWFRTECETPVLHYSYPSTWWDFLWELVGYEFPLAVMHTISIFFVHLWCMLGGSVWMWVVSGLVWYIEGQAHFSTSWHTKMSLTYMNWYMTLYKIFLMGPPHELQAYDLRNWKVLYAQLLSPDQKLCWVTGLLHFV